VTHRSTRRLLSALLDDELAAAEEAAVRTHLESCRRCRRTLSELEAAEALLCRIPASLIPLDWNPGSEARLLALARWSPAPPRHPAWPLPALGALAAAAALVLVVWSGPQPEALLESGSSPSRAVVVARIPSSFLLPSLEATGAAVPYTWRH
jgi:anti-sigma factor RsiW